MCKKLMLVIAIVWVFGLVNSASGDSYSWTGDGNDASWCNPENWDPIGVPGPGDDAIIDVPNKLCVIDCDVSCYSLTVGLGTGPCLLDIVAGNVYISGAFIIGNEVGSEGIVNKSVGTLTVGGNKIVDKDGIGTFNRHTTTRKLRTPLCPIS